MRFATPNPALALAKAKAATQYVALKRIIAGGGHTINIESPPLARQPAKRARKARP